MIIIYIFNTVDTLCASVMHHQRKVLNLNNVFSRPGPELTTRRSGGVGHVHIEKVIRGETRCLGHKDDKKINNTSLEEIKKKINLCKRLNSLVLL